MNNDISRDYVRYNKLAIHKNNDLEENKTSKEIPSENKASMEDSLKFLGSMGKTKVSMDRTSIKRSVEEFQQNPFEIEAKLNFCDTMMEEKGYDVWKAMDITDAVFQELKKEDTYRN